MQVQGGEFQVVKTKIGLPDWELEPAAPGEFLLSNVIYRVVNVDLDMITGNKVYTGTQGDSYADLGSFPTMSKRVDVYTKDYELAVLLTDAWGTAMGMFFVPAGAYVPIDIAASGAQVKCNEAALTTKYQLIVWY